jgi:hypothetical protein
MIDFLRKIYREIIDIFYDLSEEFFIIIRNRNYAKKHPNVFAIFSIIEQEQNPQIFELQKDNFERIKTYILHDENVANHRILEAIRGLFHNNKIIFGQNEIKDKIAASLFNKTKILIAQNGSYYTPLIKVILFSFPFLIDYDRFAIIKKLIRKKSKKSLRLIKEILENDDSKDFLSNFEAISSLLLSTIVLDNKSVFMLLLRFLRKNKQIPMVFAKENKIIHAKIFGSSYLKKRGFDYGAITASYYDQQFLNDEISGQIDEFFKNVFEQRMSDKERVKKYHKIRNYIFLNERMGYKNDASQELIKSHILHHQTVNCKDFKKLQKKLKKITSSKKFVIKINRQHAEEYWLMKFAPYLL